MTREFLKDILTKNGIEIKDEAVNKLTSLASLLQSFNERTNITAITADGGIAVSHFADSLLPWRCFENVSRKTLLDVGAGGGFPSLPLAIAFEGLAVRSLDSTEKKLKFITESANELNLPNISPLAGRAEELARDAGLRESFDFVTSRAVGRLEIIGELCLPFLKTGGLFLAYKGPGWEEELKAAENGIKKLGGEVENILHFPLCGDGEEKSRTVILIRKTKKTDIKYPRNYSQISKKPLK